MPSSRKLTDLAVENLFLTCKFTRYLYRHSPRHTRSFPRQPPLISLGITRDKENMANNTSSDQPLTPGHTNSPLFTILPYDVRVLIYREVFNGSKVEVVYRSERADPANRHSVFTHICLPVNRQFDLVRVCKEAYKESRHIYWTETAIKLAHTPLRTNLDGIPMCAKQRIRALEGVPLVDELYATHQIPLDHFLGHFPKLKYCQFRRGTVRMDCHYNEIPPEGLVKKSGSDAFRDLALSLNARNPPVFVQKISLWPAKDHGVSKLNKYLTHYSLHTSRLPEGSGLSG